MIRHLVFLSAYFLFSNSVFSAEVLVKTDSINVSGYSNISSDKLTVYGGIAGINQPITGDNSSPVDTCAKATTLTACNQSSVYAGLPFTVSFQVTKDVSNVHAKMFIDNGATYDTLVDLPNQTATANDTTITLTTDWAHICSSSGLGANCAASSTQFLSKSIKVGVDSDASNDVEDAERKTISLKIHIIAEGDSSNNLLNYCSVSAAGSGMCNIAFAPGDKKAFIDSAIYAGNDATSGAVDWESIAIFPVQTVSGTTEQINTLANFKPSQASPIFKPFTAADGTIPDSAVSSGGIENDKKYCFIYGTKNLAQNVYKFVLNPEAAATACVTPSDVVGLLEDKSCFISTAAFGSDMAPEVKTFRAFRNKFLLTNPIGKIFVRTYYKLSPPLADFIAHHETLRTLTRGMLYPILFYVVFALKYGMLMATALLMLIIMVSSFTVRYLKYKKTLLLIFLIFLTPTLRADVQSGEKIISHEGAKEGLVRITRDGTYIYDKVRPLKSESSKLTFGVANQPDISLDVTIKDTALNTEKTVRYNFADLYGSSSGLTIGYDYENYPWINSMGKLGYQLGGSVLFATGHGVLVADGSPSKESFTFLTIPLNAGAVYRFEYKDKQFLAPYVSGGGTFLALLEKRDDEAWPKKAGGVGFYGAGGVLFNVSTFDPDASFQLESEYGVSNLWLALEFRVTEVDSDAFTFSNQYVNAGLSFDF